MYQDIKPHIYHNEYHSCSPKTGDILLSYDGHNILMTKERTFFHYEDVSPERSYQYLFSIDTTNYFLTDLHDTDHISLNTNHLRGFEPKEASFAGITGWQIYLWMRDNQYCGRCASKMEPDLKERAMRCPNCGNILYPKISPAVIVAVTNDAGQLLVTKYAANSYQKYALIAGFNEVGETIEETCIREVKEETGIEISDLQYYKCQPWAYSSSILFGFHAKAHGDQQIHMDTTELRIARWADPTDTSIDPHDETSLTAEMIRGFLYGEEK